MKTCPHCGSLSVTVDKAGNHWFSCGSANRFKSQSCVDREPLFKALQSAKERIEELKSEKSSWIQHAARLTAIGDQIIENGSVSERLANEWNKAKANNL